MNTFWNLRVKKTIAKLHLVFPPKKGDNRLERFQDPSHAHRFRVPIKRRTPGLLTHRVLFSLDMRVLPPPPPKIHSAPSHPWCALFRVVFKFGLNKPIYWGEGYGWPPNRDATLDATLVSPPPHKSTLYFIMHPSHIIAPPPSHEATLLLSCSHHLSGKYKGKSKFHPQKVPG